MLVDLARQRTSSSSTHAVILPVVHVWGDGEEGEGAQEGAVEAQEGGGDWCGGMGEKELC